MALGTGEASLGEFKVKTVPNLYVYSGGKLRIRVKGPTLAELDLSVTDVRFYDRDHTWLLKTEIACRIRRRLGSTNPNDIVLAVGLTGPLYAFHWLQVNNVFSKADPLWC